MLMRAAAKEYKWNLNYGGIALMWRGGCIIRSIFLGKIKEAFDKHPKLTNLMLDPFFRKAMNGSHRSWRNAVAAAVKKASLCQPSAPHWLFTMGIAANGCQPTCCRHSGIILALTLTSDRPTAWPILP